MPFTRWQMFKLALKDADGGDHMPYYGVCGGGGSIPLDRRCGIHCRAASSPSIVPGTTMYASSAWGIQLHLVLCKACRMSHLFRAAFRMRAGRGTGLAVGTGRERMGLSRL